jgi:calcium/proton exchanger cax
MIIPILANAGKFAATVTSARRHKFDLAIGIIVGSTLQIGLLVTPFMVILGWNPGQPMTLCFNIYETILFLLAVVLVNCVVKNRRANYLDGILLVGTYCK